MYNFIHIPKVAGSSFYKLIEGHNDKISYFGHTRAMSSSSFYLTFVRNPYDRLVSSYFYLINSEALASELPIYKELINAYKDFKDFILNIEKDNLMEKIIHLKPMYYWICDDNHKILVEKIFKIEDINAIDTFIDELGIEKKLSDMKTNTSEHKHYLEYMDSEVIYEINKLYSLDFELFNYEKL